MLSQKADFNLHDAYEMFDPENEGCITIQKLKRGFHRLELYPTCDELVLFFKRYDYREKDALTAVDFRKVFLSKDTFFASNLKKRSKNRNGFKAETMAVFKKLIQLHLKHAVANEAVRQRLSRNCHFNALAAFNSVACGMPAINECKFKSFLDRKGFHCGKEEQRSLVRQLDIDGDGQVGMADFVEFLRPKCRDLF